MKISSGSKAMALVIGAVLAGGFATSAQANLIISLNGKKKAAVMTDTSLGIGGIVAGNYDVTSAAETGYLNLPPGDLFDTASDFSLAPKKNSGTITATYTETNLTVPAHLRGDIFSISFNGDVTNAIVTRTFFLDPKNGGKDIIELGTITTNCVKNCQSDGLFQIFEHLTAPFSLTETISVKAKGKGALLSSDDNVSFVAVPEPGTLALLGAGLVGGGIFGRRKAAKKA